MFRKDGKTAPLAELACRPVLSRRDRARPGQWGREAGTHGNQGKLRGGNGPPGCWRDSPGVTPYVVHVGNDPSVKINEDRWTHDDKRVCHWGVFLARGVIESLAEWAWSGRRLPRRWVPLDELVMTRRVP